MLVFSLKCVFGWVSLLLSSTVQIYQFRSRYMFDHSDIQYSTVQYSTLQYITSLFHLSSGGSRWPMSDRWWRVLRRAFQALLRTLHHLSPPSVILGQMEYESTVILGQMELIHLSYWYKWNWVNCPIDTTVIVPTVIVPTVLLSQLSLSQLSLSQLSLSQLSFGQMSWHPTSCYFSPI